ncbi:hypothetical protein HanPSC8_Chr14g0597781 [Helianthus annuus]|nr:hypothetical protein HanIR_Chr14g0674281 [Helianthus annuus]KAJ0628943.1 hypothetical protein HanIR_Chr00c36g0912521 [Helianthus annuus]KAJ0838692.1 hypothetical protein HanPSC8_Chr14g0597781 [Helianthus annuus]
MIQDLAITAFSLKRDLGFLHVIQDLAFTVRFDTSIGTKKSEPNQASGAYIFGPLKRDLGFLHALQDLAFTVRFDNSMEPKNLSQIRPLERTSSVLMESFQ